MDTPNSIIDLWPDAEQFARDVGLSDKSYVRVMRHRNRIPRVWWPDLIAAASRRGIRLTKDTLYRVHGLTPPAKPSRRRA
jgi:hypothetical protein